MPNNPDHMSFREFKEFVLAVGAATGGVIGEFEKFLRLGCSEAEAKRWLAAHIWDFDQPLRGQIVMAFATDALHQAAERTEGDQNDDAEIDRKIKEIWKRDGFHAAMEYGRRYRAAKRGKP